LENKKQNYSLSKKLAARKEKKAKADELRKSTEEAKLI
jgi:hypothetical protein